MPYIVDVLLFPVPIKSYAFENLLRKSYIIIMQILIVDIMDLLNEDWVPDINSIMEDLPNIEMVNSEIMCIDQSLKEFQLGCIERNIKI